MRRKLAYLTAIVMLALAAAFPAHAVSGYACTPLSDPLSERSDNIYHAAWSISQTVVAAGGSFSFNETVGPRTEERGYTSAPNGRGAEVVGGGVGQTASTLYLALMELEEGTVRFDALEFYGSRFTGDYVPTGDLAVLTDYGAGRDFAFTNLSHNEIIIEMWLAGDSLHCSVYLTDMPAMAEAASAAPFRSALVTPASGALRSHSISDTAIECGNDAGLLNNIALAADSITDTILLTGDVFSFNDIVGPRKAEFGYLPALNGRGAEVVGGGVAHVASAVWLAVKELPDVSIIEKSTYGVRYNQTYVESSSDAILTDYNAGTDFSFRYTGTGSLTIYTTLDGTTLRCEIFRTE